MGSSDRYLLRVVIQRIGVGAGAIWRIVAYGGRRTMGHADFPTREMLVDVLRTAVSGFDDAALLATGSSEDGPSILFTGEMELDDAQLSMLRLS